MLYDSLVPNNYFPECLCSYQYGFVKLISELGTSILVFIYVSGKVAFDETNALSCSAEIEALKDLHL